MDPVLTNPRAATGAELKAHIQAEREGLPFLVFRDADERHTIFVLGGRGDRIAIGRSPSAGIALAWDERVSRVHAELCELGGEWALVDDGLSMNGSYVNGTLVRGRRRLHDGDTLRVGNTALLFRDPGEAYARSTTSAGGLQRAVTLSETQQRVLIALCRPFKASTAFVTPATNEQVASELFLSVDAVKKHMRALFEKFGVDGLPQNEKRTRLVERAFAGGFVSERDL
jgi:pSer/pThr/pTyr-binding forkhead associated (FHA) protein